MVLFVQKGNCKYPNITKGMRNDTYLRFLAKSKPLKYKKEKAVLKFVSERCISTSIIPSVLVRDFYFIFVS
jgi:hypothetical protein